LLAVEESGRGEPLVLIHGLATTRAIWSTVAPALARSCRVVTLDVPGFGQSEPTGRDFRLEAVADRIARGLTGRGVPTPFDLVGHSLGAGIALTLAATRPRLVRRLVLVAPAGLIGVPTVASRVLAATAEPVLAARRVLAPLVDLPWGRRLLLATVAADGARISPTEARQLLKASSTARRTGAALSTIMSTDMRPLLAETTVPLGVIWGAGDRTVPVWAARLVREARPDADVVVLQRAGHVVMVERPEAFVSALEGLLARLPKDETTSASATSTVT
jgi:pimeloyl-ACP methyl ester carboxylesterase